MSDYANDGQWLKNLAAAAAGNAAIRAKWEKTERHHEIPGLAGTPSQPAAPAAKKSLLEQNPYDYLLNKHGDLLAALSCQENLLKLALNRMEQCAEAKRKHEKTPLLLGPLNTFIKYINAKMLEDQLSALSITTASTAPITTFKDECGPFMEDAEKIKRMAKSASVCP